MALTEKQLLELKEDINNAKTKASELTGQEQVLLRQFKLDWGCKTIKEGESKLDEIDRSISSLDKKIKKASEELEESLNNLEDE